MGWQEVELRGGLGALSMLGGFLGGAGVVGGRPQDEWTWLGNLSDEEIAQRQALAGERRAIAQKFAELKQMAQGYEARNTLFEHDLAARRGIPAGVDLHFRDNVNGLYIDKDDAERHGIRVPDQDTAPSWSEPKPKPEWADRQGTSEGSSGGGI